MCQVVERELRPAVDRGPRPLAEEAAPSLRPASARRGGCGGTKRLGHSAASSVSAPPRSTETSRLTPFSIIVTP